VMVMTTEITEPIAQFVRDHATEFRVGFGFAKLDGMSDQQIVGILLATCGIATKRQRRGSIYRVDQERLSALLSVLKRRQSNDPHHLVIDRESEVWISSESAEIPQVNPGKEQMYPQSLAHLTTDGDEWSESGASLSA
jgi:hypothetical protein